MTWEEFCELIGISSSNPDMSSNLDLLNTAFIVYVDCEEYDTDTERILEEDYDW